MKILITGSNGFIGKNLYHSLPLKYLDRNQIVFNWDPQDTWYPE